MPVNDIGTFLSAFMGPVNEKLEERHQNEQKLKDAQRKIQMDQYQDVLNNPQNYDPAIYPQLRKQASDALGKLLNPEARKMHGKIGGIVDKIQGIFAGPQAKQAGQQMPPPQLPSQGQPGGQPVAGAPQSAAQTLGAPNFGQFLDQASAARLRDPVQFERDRIWQKVKQAKTPEERQDAIDEAVFRTTGRYTPPKSAQPKAKKLVTYTKPDGTDVPTMWDSSSGLFYKRDNPNEVVQIEDNWVQKAGPANVRPIITPITLTRANALDEAERGMELLNAKGEPLDPNTISEDPNVILRGFLQNGQLRYAESHIDSKTIRLGNWLIPITPAQMDVNAPRNLPSPFPVPIQPGTTTQTERVLIGPDGQPIAVPLETKRVPNTAPAPGAARALPGPQLQSPQGAPGTPPARPQSAPGTPPTGATPRGARPLPGVPSGMATQQENQAASITGVVGTLFGDPEFPNLKSLSDFAYLADRPDSRQRIAAAVDLVQKAGDENSADLATIHAGPVSVGFGAAGDWVSYFLQLPRWASGQKVDTVNRAMQALAKHPDEVEAFNAFMTANADIIALRSLTKSSPALANARAIRNELANMMTTTSSKAFRDSLARTAGVIQKGVQFNRFIKPGLRARMEQAMGGKAPTAGAERNLSNPKDEEIKKKLDKIF